MTTPYAGKEKYEQLIYAGQRGIIRMNEIDRTHDTREAFTPVGVGQTNPF